MKAHLILRRLFCLTLLATAWSLPGMATTTADDTGAATESEKKPARTAKPRKAAKPALREARLPHLLPTSPDNVAETEMLGQTVFQVLLAEIALRRGDPALASSAYADLALRTRDPKVLERTVDIALYGRRFDVALDAARLWTEIDADSKKANYVLASVMIVANQVVDLPATLSRLFEMDAEALPENLLSLNRMLARIPNRQTAFQIIERVCRPYPAVAEARYAVAVAAAASGQEDRARAETRRALELRPDWERAALLQAQLLHRISAQEAAAFLKAFTDKNPQAHEARMQLARLMVGEKRYEDARQQFERLLKDTPDNPDVVFALAVMALQQQDQKSAETHFKHFLTLPVADKTPAFFFLGQIAEENKRFDEALDYYANVTSGTHFGQARLRRARLLADQGRIEEARRQLQPPKDVSAEDRIQLTIAEAALLREAKQYRTAFDLLEDSLVKQPQHADLLYESALLLEKLDDLERMEQRLRQLIELNPENFHAYNALGYALADRNQRLPEARELIEKALRLSPNDFFILDSMGWVLYRQGDFAGALTYLEKAYDRRDDPEIAAHIGEVMWAMGRHAEARQIWLKAQEKHPDNESLTEVIKKFLP